MFGFGGGFGGKAASKESTGRAHTSTSKESTGRAHSSTPSKAAEKGGRVGGPSADKGDRVGSTDTGRFGGGSYNASNGSKGKSSTGTDTGRFGGGSSNPSRGGGASPSRGFSAGGVDPSRFGGGLSTADKGDRLGTPTRGMAPPDRSYRESEIGSLRSLDRMHAEGAIRGAETERASQARAAENASMGMYNAAAAVSEANARRADVSSSIRAAENKSMDPYHDALNSFLGITREAEAGTLDPYNTLSGGKKADITSMSIAEADAYAKTSWKGKTANVLGAYQFKDTTLTGIAREIGLPPDTKMTADVQSKLAVALAQRRANAATVNGKVDVDKFAKGLAQEWASFATPTGKSHYDKNGIDKASVSYADVRSIAQGLVDTGVVGPRRSLSAIGDDPALTAGAIGAPTSRFASAYLGKDERSMQEKQVDYFGSVPDDNWSGNEKVAAGQVGPDGRPLNDGTTTASVAPSDAGTTAQPVSASSDDTSVYGNSPVAGEGDFPERPRSTGETVAAAGIDLGLGMIPGFGMGIGLINGGLALTGNRTLGEHIVDAIATGEGGTYTPSDGDPNRGEEIALNEKDTATTVPKKTKSFEERYMAFVDPTKRPTPKQKWGTDAPYTV